MKVERHVERSTDNEVRRRNGRRKPARTRADRILVLTEAVRGNSYGFVASGTLLAYVPQADLRQRQSSPPVAGRNRLWNARFDVENATFLWTA
jgi:hypothetical protein